MEINLDQGKGLQIKRLENNCIFIDETSYCSSLILTPTKLITDWPIQNISNLTEQMCAPLLELSPQIIVLGTTENQTALPAELMAKLTAQAGLEVMNIQAACRTYNILMMEERRVVAGFIMPRPQPQHD